MCRTHSLQILARIGLTTNLCAFLFLFTNISLALPDDSEQIMHIKADSSAFDYKGGQSTYEGNVKIDQGSSHLTADRVITKNNADHKIEEAIAYGKDKLAEYTTIPKPGDQLFHAKANVIKFYPPKSMIILEGKVIVTQGENSFNGPLIIYNIKDQTVVAPASKGGRATIIIDPNELKT
ncbi:MAG: lipopolysaccharide transport periplasmic protein LptA [Gammaproteobacteria bacterium]